MANVSSAEHFVLLLTNFVLSEINRLHPGNNPSVTSTSTAHKLESVVKSALENKSSGSESLKTCLIGHKSVSSARSAFAITHAQALATRKPVRDCEAATDQCAIIQGARGMRDEIRFLPF